MTTVFQIASKAESLVYHGLDQDPAAPGALTAVLVAPQVTDIPEEDGRAAFSEALTQIARGRWWLFQLATDGNGNWGVSKVLGVERRFTVDAAFVGVLGWLETQRLQSNVAPFWTGSNAIDGEVEITRATAFDLVGAAAGWTAPVPQRLGLVALLGHEDVAVPAVLVLLSDAAAEPNAAEFQVEVVEAEDPLTPISVRVTHPEAECVTTVLNPYQAPDGEADETQTFFPETGLVQIPEGSAALAAFKATLESEGPARLWSYPALVGLNAGAATAPNLSAEQINMLRMATVTALFDTILAGLMLPVALSLGHASRRSRVCALLEAFLAEAIEVAAAEVKAAGQATVQNADWQNKAATMVDGILRAMRSQVGEARSVHDAAKAVFGDDPRFAAVFADVVAEQPVTAVLAWLAETTGPLATHLGTEEGTEAFVLWQIAAAMDRYVAAAGPDALPQAVRSQAFQAFAAELQGVFDTAGALRTDAGSEIALALLSRKTTVEDALGVLEGPNWWHWRFGGEGDPKIALAAYWIAPAQLDEKLRALLPDWGANIRSTIGTLGQGGLFRPDPSPQPLNVRFLPGLDPEDAGRVAERISGFGFVVANRGDAAEPAQVSHVSLVSLKQGEADLAAATVMPTFPALSNGAAEMFLPYTGKPVASPNLPGSRHDAASGTDRGETDRVPPYRVGEAVSDTLVRPPELAYGIRYAVSAFWIAQSGALPVAVRGADPFTPGAPDVPFPDTAFTAYLRRTAISPTTLAEANGSKRIGHIPADVFPLAMDAPRIGLGGLAPGMRWLDLFRLADGTGALGTGDRGRELRLDDVDLIDIGIDAVALVWRTPDKPDDPGWPITCSYEPAMSRIVAVLPDDLPDGAWLRMTLEGTTGRIAFAPPERGDRQQPADLPPLLLMAGQASGFVAIPHTTDLTIKAPGVSFADFECWAANNSNLARMTGAAGSNLLKALRRARAVFEALGETSMVDKLDALPDPAVTALLISVDPLDRLDGGLADWGNAAPKSIAISPYQHEQLVNAAMAEDFGVALAELRKLITRIHAAASLRITVRVGGTPALVIDGDVVVTLPPGQTACLRMCPLVDSALFEGNAVFDPGMAQLAQGRWRNGKTFYHLFEGAEVMVEVMQPLTNNGPVATDAFRIAPEGTARAYALTCTPETVLRPYASVDLVTQRWRATGLPIYDWVEPALMGASGPVVAVTRDSRVAAFEADAFAGRSAGDGAMTRHRIPIASGRLGAVAAADPLLREEWPVRSATWLRHRVVLRSRYAGATRAPEAATRRIGVAQWDRSVAFLAEVSGAELTRPQLRAFLPLAHRVPGDATQVAAPLLAVLNEPPMAQLGLAERIVAEIATTRRFGFQNDQLSFEQLRKEVGPDPRLSYQGIPDEASRRVTLDCEGPFGLHFEGDATLAPRFVNSQLLLQPVHSDPLDESFAGVTLRRMADPGWIWTPSAAPAAWHRIDLAADLLALTLEDDGGALVSVTGNAGILTVQLRKDALFDKADQGFVTLCTVVPVDGEHAALVIDDRAGDRVELIVVLRAGTTKLQTTGRGLQDRAVASVLLQTKGRIRPLAAAHLAMASAPTFVEWVRTARDVARFVVDDELALIDQLTPKIDVQNAVAFFRGADRVRLQCPVMAKPIPLGVHRHLAAVTTRPSDTVGRERQLFDEARLADFHGMLRLTRRSDRMNLHLMEFETPARVLLSQNGAQGQGHLEAFETARFDLVATRPRGQRALPARMRLMIRAVDRSFQQNEAVTLTARFADGQAFLTLPLAMPADSRGLIAQRNGTNWHAWAQTDAGLVPAGQAVETVQADSVDGFTLTLGTVQPIWTDVSLLHGSAGGDDLWPAVDFDWFFGTPQTDSLAEATAPPALNALPEAQARIVAITPPLELKS